MTGGAAAGRDPLDAVAGVLGERARLGEPLGAHTTYRVGGPAAVTVHASDRADLDAVHEALAEVGEPVAVLVLGKGSNLLVADGGFRGLVVVLEGSYDAVTIDGTEVRAGGAAGLPVVARRSAAAGLRGLEWAVGVPGSVGGAVRMNAGGHGSDTAAVLRDCRLFDLSDGRRREVSVDDLDLGYRRSSLGPADIVEEARFGLRAGDPGAAQAVVAEVVHWRRLHQPGGSNAGSVFTNPVGDSAGRLVDAAGLKGLRIGSAVVSDKHANFIQADDGGSADDVRRLIDRVRDEVATRFGIVLQPELRMVGFEDSPSFEVLAVAAQRGPARVEGERR